MVFKQRLEGNEGVSQEEGWGKCIPLGMSQCTDPLVEVCLACSSNSREDSGQNGMSPEFQIWNSNNLEKAIISVANNFFQLIGNSLWQAPHPSLLQNGVDPAKNTSLIHHTHILQDQDSLLIRKASSFFTSKAQMLEGCLCVFVCVYACMCACK